MDNPMTATPQASADAPMLTALLNLLAPLLVASGLTDAAARQALATTFTRFAAHDEIQWLSASQIVGYTLSGLDTLRASAGISAPDHVIALRGTAARMAGSAARAERSLAVQQRAIPPPHEPPEYDTGGADNEHAILAVMAATASQVRAAQAAVVPANAVTPAAEAAPATQP